MFGCSFNCSPPQSYGCRGIDVRSSPKKNQLVPESGLHILVLDTEGPY